MNNKEKILENLRLDLIQIRTLKEQQQRMTRSDTLQKIFYEIEIKAVTESINFYRSLL